jgi:serine/threonine-protein kinase
MSRNVGLLWERWDEVDRLLNAVLELPPEERAASLAREAAHDPPLRDLVRQLLGRLEGATDRLDGPAEAVVRGAFSGGEKRLRSEDLAPGTVVDRYSVVAFRGRGGMASVYEARRTDGAFEQRVALKVLRRGLDTDDLIRRFVRERQILSSLAHPNIARLIDGGALTDGRPYLIMDLVDGTRITDYADAARLAVPGRLELFLGVARAIHAAHQQLVVHRDIKPSNILVDAVGHVTLLDFGIARLLAGDPGLTETGARILTPDYASPEQIRGAPITTGTDIYQLGLLLRELLTGLPPLAGDTNPGELPIHPSRAAAIDIGGFPTPDERAGKRATTPARLAHTLAGDLDIIVSKALRPDP